MKSAKKSKFKDELDEDTPSKETLARRRDRKLKDDITNMMVSSSLVYLVFQHRRLHVCMQYMQRLIFDLHIFH